MRKIVRSKAVQISDETPLRNKLMGRGYAYAKKWLEDVDPAIGTAPYSEIDAQTLMQRAWFAGYKEALDDIQRKWYKGDLTPDDFKL